MVIALFDFDGDWFVPPYEKSLQDAPGNMTVASSMLTDALGDKAALFVSAINSTAETVTNMTMLRAAQKAPERPLWSMVGLAWLREAVAKGELRIDCLNTVVRL